MASSPKRLGGNGFLGESQPCPTLEQHDAIRKRYGSIIVKIEAIGKVNVRATIYFT
jgi:hypothetical protein